MPTKSSLQRRYIKSLRSREERFIWFFRTWFTFGKSFLFTCHWLPSSLSLCAAYFSFSLTALWFQRRAITKSLFERGQKKLFFGRQRFPAGRCWWRACLLLKNRTLPPPLPPSSFLCRSANVCTTACTASTNKPSTIPFSSHILTFIWHTKPHGSFWGTLTPLDGQSALKRAFGRLTNLSFSLIFLKGCRIWSLIPLWARFVNNWCIEGRRAECNATNYLGLWFKLSLRMVLLSFFPTARTAFPAAKTFQGGARKGERSVLGPTLILRFSSAWNKSWREEKKQIQNQFAENESDRSKVGKVMARKSGKEWQSILH